MRLFNTRSKGDFAISYELSAIDCSLQGHFDLDPSLLLQILRDFESLAISNSGDVAENA